jgi:hypothetical protein
VYAFNLRWSSVTCAVTWLNPFFFLKISIMINMHFHINNINNISWIFRWKCISSITKIFQLLTSCPEKHIPFIIEMETKNSSNNNVCENKWFSLFIPIHSIQLIFIVVIYFAKIAVSFLFESNRKVKWKYEEKISLFTLFKNVPVRVVNKVKECATSWGVIDND